MEVHIIGKHMQVTPRMREHIEEKLEKMGKFQGVIETKVVLKLEKYLYIAEITSIGKHLRFYGEGRSEANFFAAFDEAEAKVAAQLKKRKERIKDHKVPARREIAELANLGLEPERILRRRRSREEGRVVSEAAGGVKPMSVEEAHMQLNLTRKPFVIFRNTDTNTVNVLYRRGDGNFGLIESES